MKQRTSLRTICGVLALAAAGMAGVASAADSSEPKVQLPQASIPFANHGGIRDWTADRDRGVWVQDQHRRWYYAKLMGPCMGLNFAEAIGFDTHPLGRFDKWSSIIVPGSGRCAVQSFLPSAGPPPKADQRS